MILFPVGLIFDRTLIVLVAFLTVVVSSVSFGTVLSVPNRKRIRLRLCRII